MFEPQRLYNDILRALTPLLPRSVYQEIRRVRTLAWAMVGLCLTQQVHLSAWAQVLQGRATLAASRERRFSRWLHHPAILPSDWYRPVIQAALSDWPAVKPLFVALDTTALTPFVLIRASLIYRGRAIPLAWRVLRHQSTTVAFEDYQPVLEQVVSMGKKRIVVLADRGFAHERLLEYLRTHGFQFRLRLKGSTLVHLRGARNVPVKTLCPAIGVVRFVQSVFLFSSAFGPVSLALAVPLEHPDDPWYVASSEPTNQATLQEYGLRFGVEEAFRDDKSGGFQLQDSRLAEASALERLGLEIGPVLRRTRSFGLTYQLFITDRTLVA